MSREQVYKQGDIVIGTYGHSHVTARFGEVVVSRDDKVYIRILRKKVVRNESFGEVFVEPVITPWQTDDKARVLTWDSAGTGYALMDEEGTFYRRWKGEPQYEYHPSR